MFLQIVKRVKLSKRHDHWIRPRAGARLRRQLPEVKVEPQQRLAAARQAPAQGVLRV